MDLFAEKFSVPPKESDSSSRMQRIMLNVLYGVVGIAQSYTNNICEYSSFNRNKHVLIVSSIHTYFLPVVYSTMFQGFLTQTMRSQITTTSSYTIFTGWAVGKDYLLP